MSNRLRSKTKTKWLVFLVLIVSVMLLLADFPQVYNGAIDEINERFNKEYEHLSVRPFHLGLDLQGGTHLVYEADTSEYENDEKGGAVEGVRDVIERRVNAFGVSEPVVQVNKSGSSWRVIVELAGVKDIKQAIAMIGETPLLEFKQENNEPPRELTTEERQELERLNEELEVKAEETLDKALAGADFSEIVRDSIYSLEAADEEQNFFDIESNEQVQQMIETGGEIGWVSAQDGLDEIFDAAEQTPVGAVTDELVEAENGYNIIKVLEARENGEESDISHILICYEGKDNCESGNSQEDARELIDQVKERASSQTFASLALEYSTGPTAEQGGDLSWVRQGQMVEPFENAMNELADGEISEVVETKFGYHLIYKKATRPVREYRLAVANFRTLQPIDILPPADPWEKTELTGAYLDKSRVEFDQRTNIPQVALKFNDQGKELFAQITEENVGKRVAIFLDGEAISIPRVNEPITGGEAVITGDFDITEAKILSQRLNAGALPVPIKLISQQSVGATLGQDSMQRSLFAGLLGLALVALFMITVYRLPGVLAVLALGFYGLTVLFLFKLIPVTLTLAGMAGFILSVGMAVDANVLIFERLKEELKIGKPLGTAIDEAFKRAWTSIRDGNVSTLITCFILAWFGTSMIKGFAITLSLGVLTSMFSAIVITKLFLKLTINPEKLESRLWLFGVKRNKNQEK